MGMSCRKMMYVRVLLFSVQKMVNEYLKWTIISNKERLTCRVLILKVLHLHRRFLDSSRVHMVTFLRVKNTRGYGFERSHLKALRTSTLGMVKSATLSGVS